MSIEDYDFCVPTEYTYKDMTKPERREWMSKCVVATLGTKSGGFGQFTPEFKVVSCCNGVGNIRSEIANIAEHLNVDADYIINGCPTLKELIGERDNKDNQK